ncbi:hypothetical protein GE21DRAFT_9498 [Neurospora crassa]|uniref:Uncharacterized protein n=2 Tax=Neurospora crassa TaxID=5141 RepID=Q7RYF8_NEUCR|nr:hypothetical protein NCU05108 [Neurospora crassa OR74A]EAA27858.2 hypothetical protein NCU05108 [Neurospora crassa OR74A]KHE87978.1 hypothetical protein GE21DRAFT_9498 [Neurospora crassa]CAD70433.1 hypothetical protein [Neurospora crassa]|eukprot:XP_957094.2 hypothetical protein NCU05108 [Neurospora crassa OR74A]
MKSRPDSLSIATLPSTYFRVLDSKHFCGEIIIEKDRGKAIETACRAHRVVSTSTNITLAIFTDGSRRCLGGAYAIAFKRYAPGTEEHGCEVTAAWPVFHQTTNGCELLAVKQAIKVAITELATLERQLPPKHKSKVQVQIFSDSMFTLEHLAGITESMSRESDHISSMYRWSKRFRERFAGRNSPFEVKLQLLWVPGHVDKVKLHCKADEVAGIVSETTMSLLTVGGEKRPCRHWDSVIQKLSRELPAPPYEVASRVAEGGHAEDQDDDYDLFPCEADINGPANNLEVLEGSNDYEMYGNDNHLQPQRNEERQDISFEQWVNQCQDIQQWNQLSAEFQGCYQQWYTLFRKQLQEGDVDQEMGGT